MTVYLTDAGKREVERIRKAYPELVEKEGEVLKVIKEVLRKERRARAP
jgi:hypothetical protein